METTIQTINGTYIVPKQKEAELLQWLQNNAIRQGQQNLGELKGNYNGQQLIGE
jgi:hypothetical protein